MENSEVAHPPRSARIRAAPPWVRPGDWSGDGREGMGREGSTRTALAPRSPERGRPGALRAHGQSHPRAPRSPPPTRKARWGCPARDKGSGRRSPAGATARLESSRRVQPLAPNLPKLRSPGRAGKAPRYLRGHKGQIHGVAGVAAAARAGVLAAAAAAAAGPAACTAGRERAEQRTGTPHPAAPPTSAAPASRPRQPPRSALQIETRPRRGAGRGGAGLGGPGAPPRDRSQPHPKGGARRNPRAPKIPSRVGAASGS